MVTRGASPWLARIHRRPGDRPHRPNQIPGPCGASVDLDDRVCFGVAYER